MGVASENKWFLSIDPEVEVEFDSDNQCIILNDDRLELPSEEPWDPEEALADPSNEAKVIAWFNSMHLDEDEMLNALTDAAFEFNMEA